MTVRQLESARAPIGARRKPGTPYGAVLFRIRGRGVQRATRTPASRAALGLLALAVAVALGIGSCAGSELVVESPVERPDAILSLASHEWERLPATAALAADHPGALVLLTLPLALTPHNCHDCGSRATRLADAGVDARRIRILPITKGSGTYGEALTAREFLVGSGLRRVVIVTSPYHTRRSLATFRTVLDGTGIEVGIVPASASSPARPTRWWTAPYDRWYVGYEWAAVFYYAARYRVPAV
jgi:uncharacterized SAM-binding protein YcdF (DUF218 family)